MEAEHAAADCLLGPILNEADHRIAIFDGRRKLTLLERAAHPAPFALGHFTAENEAFGAPADGTDKAPDQHLARRKRSQRLRSDLAPAWCYDPKCPCLMHRNHNRTACLHRGRIGGPADEPPGGALGNREMLCWGGPIR
jgi:hypothetical protein